VFVALGIQHATHMHLIATLPCPPLQYFCTSYKDTIFEKQKKLLKLLSETCFIWRRIERDV